MIATGLRLLCTVSLGVVAMVLAWAPASAQTISSNSASYNAGYGRVAGQENRPVEFGMRDANGNLSIINGVITSGATAGAFASGAASASSGAGSGSSVTAIGNNLTVITQGDNNVVIVNSRQTNTGNVSASQSGGSNDHGS